MIRLTAESLMCMTLTAPTLAGLSPLSGGYVDTLTIIFAGLIAHVLTAGGVQRAVIVAAPNHAARLIVRSSDILSESRPSLREDSGAPAGVRWFNIAGVTIKFGGLPAGTPIIDSSFADQVVPLSIISDATDIRPEIESGRLFSGAVAYVDVRAGTLSASDLFPQQVTFDGSRWSGSKCLAEHVVFTGRAAIDVVQIRASSGATITVRAGAVLRVENEPTSSLAPHFDMYRQLLVGCTTFALPLRTGNSCQTEVLTRSASIHRLMVDSSECTNSHWP
jgi:hypothetical protein